MFIYLYALHIEIKYASMETRGNPRGHPRPCPSTYKLSASRDTQLRWKPVETLAETRAHIHVLIRSLHREKFCFSGNPWKPARKPAAISIYLLPLCTEMPAHTDLIILLFKGVDDPFRRHTRRLADENSRIFRRGAGETLRSWTEFWSEQLP